MFFFCSKFLEGLVSYSIPKGVQRGLEIDLSDQTYDGRDEGDRLVGGLGQLVDGQVGTDNFRTDIHGYGKGMYVCPVCPSACQTYLVIEMFASIFVRI